MNMISVNLGEKSHRHELYPVADKSPDRQILVFPTWAGITDFERGVAARLNNAGHSAILVDFFGENADLSTLEKKQLAISPYLQDLALLQAHISALVVSVRQALPAATHPMSAIGFCLGGLCAIHAGLQEHDVDTAVSFHGLLKLPSITGHAARHARFLILNGSRDPMVSADEVTSAIQFFDNRALDMTLVSFGGTYHSFMLPDADNPKTGVLYNAQSAKHAWTLCENFLSEAEKTGDL
ncbi:dienelactone hydrolase family protein [Marinobacterium sp. MBR-109]|uniref:dienelactone hydrolase family protein n=1 Tax=Marinobacterium sp. MBR-109 TaxID=3156462 RepID=UPI00339A5787